MPDRLDRKGVDADVAVTQFRVGAERQENRGMTTPATDVASRTPLGQRRIVGYNPTLAAFACCALLGVFAFSWGVLASPPDDVSSLLNVLPAMCLLATVLPLLGSCRVVVDPAGFIDVINLVVIRRVPVSELVAVEHEDGLHLRVSSGRRIGSVAHGSSLLGDLLHYPRSVRAARRIEAAIGGMTRAPDVAGWRQDTVRSLLRIRAFLCLLAVDAVLVLGTFLLNAVETAAQH